MYELMIGNKNYSSWSLRPWLLMRELAIPFAERLEPFGHGDFRRFSPTGKVPCLVDGARVVWDSLGITEYLAERHAGVWPHDEDARAWARCASAEMHSGFGALRGNCPMNLGVRVNLDAVTPALTSDIARVEELWDEGIRRFGGPFLAGQAFTAADAFFGPVAFRFMIYGIPLGGTAHAYAERLRALAPMREWYEAALREPWRDAEHEEECRQLGTWTADLRQSESA